jgi:2-hydroxychromene-2-carboxylate isomerase
MNTRVKLFTSLIVAGLMIATLFGALVFTGSAEAEDQFPKLTPELADSLNNPDATWPVDPAVPDLPPLAKTDEPVPPKDNFLNTHLWEGLHPPKEVGPTLRPRTRPVTSEDPLKVDVIFSMRSPYSYLVLQRLVWLNSNYNVDVTIRMVLPEAVRSTKGGSGKAGGAFGRFYFVPYAMWDALLQGQYLGVPFKWPTPDPIWQTLHPPMGKNWLLVHPPEKQPYIGWIVRLACYAELNGKSIDYVNEIDPLIWGDQVEHWPAHVKERFNRIDGLDYDKAIRYIQKNPEEIDRCWTENTKVQFQAGHGGVPLMIINGEPFFGGDRFDQFFFRLRENGLTKRQEPRPPFTTKPLHWPGD